MKILVVNCGSSSLKYQLIDMTDESVVAKGRCDRIGIDGTFFDYQRQGYSKETTMVDGKKVKIVDFKIKKRDLEKITTYISVTIIEGRNHIVKKLFQSLGFEVIKLTRTNYDFLDLGNVKSGEYRALTIKEVKKLFSK